MQESVGLYDTAVGFRRVAFWFVLFLFFPSNFLWDLCTKITPMNPVLEIFLPICFTFSVSCLLFAVMWLGGTREWDMYCSIVFPMALLSAAYTFVAFKKYTSAKYGFTLEQTFGEFLIFAGCFGGCAVWAVGCYLYSRKSGLINGFSVICQVATSIFLVFLIQFL